MTDQDETLTAKQQLEALTPDIVRAYAGGELAWSQIRRRHGVLDFGLLIRRVGEEGLRLPRAATDRPTRARGWLRDALRAPAAG